jgi:hypothetical protein
MLHRDGSDDVDMLGRSGHEKVRIYNWAVLGSAV